MIKLSKVYSKITVVLSIMFLSLIQTIQAQETGGGSGGGVNVSITKDNGNWYTQPWVWIIGGAVFLLLLVALLRNNNSRN